MQFQGEKIRVEIEVKIQIARAPPTIVGLKIYICNKSLGLDCVLDPYYVIQSRAIV